MAADPVPFTFMKHLKTEEDSSQLLLMVAVGYGIPLVRYGDQYGIANSDIARLRDAAKDFRKRRALAIKRAMRVKARTHTRPTGFAVPAPESAS